MRENSIEIDNHQLFLRKSLDNSNVGLIFLKNGKITDVNKKFLNIIGYAREEFLKFEKHNLKNIVIKDDFDNLLRNFNDIIDGKLSFLEDYYVRIINKKKQIVHLSIYIKLDIDANNDKLILISIIDISDRKRLEKQLIEKNEQLNIALENSRISLWDWDLRTDKIFNDQMFAQILGQNPHKLNLDFEDYKNYIHKEDVEGLSELIYAHLEGLTPYYESFYRFALENGEWVWILDKGRITERDSKGKPLRMIGTHQDITKSKNLEFEFIERANNLEELTKILENSLYEKDALMREIHHRVKNNLQIISSITMFHEKSSQEYEVKNIFKEFQLRIKAMAQIHETLYRSEDLENVEVSRYIRNLVDNLILSYELDTKRIRLNLEIAKIYMNLSKAMHFGLIINELVSNAFKYAFPNNRSGQIDIKLINVDDNAIELYIHDDGVGVPESFDLSNPLSMGMKIVKISTKQLKGKIFLEKNDGTCWKLKFNIKNLK